MERLTNNRFYFDFNATSPFAPSVKSWLTKGDFVFANPSSVHTDGKKSKRVITETTDYLFNLFSFNQNEFDIFYHSGATESINSIIKGFGLRGEKISFAYFKSDHSCIREQKEFLESLGHEVIQLEVNNDGDYDLKEVIKALKLAKHTLLVNFTWVNNETGVVFDLKDAEEIKEHTGAYIHVDAVQSVGKIDEWKALSPKLDSYSYSAHKFGAMKGIGFSFIKTSMPACPLITGGGQQKGHRSGTENIVGIQTIKLALEYLEEHYDYKEQRSAKDFLVNEITSLIDNKNDKAEIVSRNAKKTNGQTVYIVFKSSRSDITSVAFDLAGIDVSTGSACSSGAVKASKVLLALGYDEERSKSAIRFSFSPYLKKEKMENEYAPKIIEIISRFTS